MEKLNKYKDLEIEVEGMWGLKTTTVPVVMGALGTIKKGMESYINKIPGNINIHELQKIKIKKLNYNDRNHNNNNNVMTI